MTFKKDLVLISLSRETASNLGYVASALAKARVYRHIQNLRNIELLIKMSKYWRDIVSRLTPYTPGEQPKDKILLKLNTNENPYSPSTKVLDAIKNKCKVLGCIQILKV